ncbi:hypothetical protein EDD11_010496 [Mortierella claussenii]|nr:hypothetical protein EDD11_010496 [Mortierella claussenii]
MAYHGDSMTDHLPLTASSFISSTKTSCPDIIVPFVFLRCKPTLSTLPPELLSKIAFNLALHEYSHLSRTCSCLHKHLFHPAEIIQFLKTRYRLSAESGSIIIFAYLANMQVRAPLLLERIFENFFADSPLHLKEEEQWKRQCMQRTQALTQQTFQLNQQTTDCGHGSHLSSGGTLNSKSMTIQQINSLQQHKTVEKVKRQAKWDAVRMLGVLYALDKTHVEPSSSSINALVLSGASDITDQQPSIPLTSLSTLTPSTPPEHSCEASTEQRLSMNYHNPINPMDAIDACLPDTCMDMAYVAMSDLGLSKAPDLVAREQGQFRVAVQQRYPQRRHSPLIESKDVMAHSPGDSSRCSRSSSQTDSENLWVAATLSSSSSLLSPSLLRTPYHSLGPGNRWLVASLPEDHSSAMDRCLSVKRSPDQWWKGKQMQDRTISNALQGGDYRDIEIGETPSIMSETGYRGAFRPFSDDEDILHSSYSSFSSPSSSSNQESLKATAPSSQIKYSSYLGHDTLLHATNREGRRNDATRDNVETLHDSVVVPQIESNGFGSSSSGLFRMPLSTEHQKWDLHQARRRQQTSQVSMSVTEDSTRQASWKRQQSSSSSSAQPILSRNDKITFLTKYTNRMRLRLQALGIKDWGQEDIQRKKTYQLMIQHNDKTGEKDLVQFYLGQYGGTVTPQIPEQITEQPQQRQRPTTMPLAT